VAAVAVQTRRPTKAANATLLERQPPPPRLLRRDFDSHWSSSPSSARPQCLLACTHAPARPPGEDTVHVVQQAFHFLSFLYSNVLVCSTENSTRNTRQEYTSIRYLTLTVAPIDDVPPPPLPLPTIGTWKLETFFTTLLVNCGLTRVRTTRPRESPTLTGPTRKADKGRSVAQHPSLRASPSSSPPLPPSLYLSLRSFAFLPLAALIHIVCLHVSQRSDVLVYKRT
jgi:hypothetical protein